MTSLPLVSLGEALELAYGKNLPRNIRSAGNVPVYGSNGIAGWHDTPLVKTPTVIVGRKGGAGVVHYVDRPCFPIDTAYFVRPRETFSLDMRFVYYLLKHLDLTRLATATGVPGLTREDAYRELIRVPPLTEQERVAELLSRAEGIVRLCGDAQRKAKELIPALFLDMFGDTATNPRGWPTASIGDLVERFEGGKNVQAGDATSAEYRILKISAVTSGRYIESEAKPAPIGLAPPITHFVRTGDLLISRANTEALVGAVALVEETDGATLLPDKLWRFVWRGGTTIDQNFALHLFQQASTRAMLSSVASGTGGSMKNISQAKLKRLRLPVPPVKLQQQFVAKADAARSIVAQQTNAMTTAQSTFNALLSRSFQH